MVVVLYLKIKFLCQMTLCAKCNWNLPSGSGKNNFSVMSLILSSFEKGSYHSFVHIFYHLPKNALCQFCKKLAWTFWKKISLKTSSMQFLLGEIILKVKVKCLWQSLKILFFCSSTIFFFTKMKPRMIAEPVAIVVW